MDHISCIPLGLEGEQMHCEYKPYCPVVICPQSACGLRSFMDDLSTLKSDLNIGPGSTSEKNRKRVAIAATDLFVATVPGGIQKDYWLERQLYEYGIGLLCDPIPAEESYSTLSAKNQAGFDPLKLCWKSGPREELGRFPRMILSYLRKEERNGRKPERTDQPEEHHNGGRACEVPGGIEGNLEQLEAERRSSLSEAWSEGLLR